MHGESSVSEKQHSSKGGNGIFRHHFIKTAFLVHEGDRR